CFPRPGIGVSERLLTGGTCSLARDEGTRLRRFHIEPSICRGDGILLRGQRVDLGEPDLYDIERRPVAGSGTRHGLGAVKNPARVPKFECPLLQGRLSPPLLLRKRGINGRLIDHGGSILSARGRFVGRFVELAPLRGSLGRLRNG